LEEGSIGAVVVINAAARLLASSLDRRGEQAEPPADPLPPLAGAFRESNRAFLSSTGIGGRFLDRILSRTTACPCPCAQVAGVGDDGGEGGGREPEAGGGEARTQCPRCVICPPDACRACGGAFTDLGLGLRRDGRQQAGAPGDQELRRRSPVPLRHDQEARAAVISPPRSCLFMVLGVKNLFSRRIPFRLCRKAVKCEQKPTLTSSRPMTRLGTPPIAF
jgi:hypothetical protein